MSLYRRKGRGQYDQSERASRASAQSQYYMQIPRSANASQLTGYPPDIQQSLDTVQVFAAARMAKKCHKCGSGLTDGFSAKNWIRNWSQRANNRPENAATFCSATCPECGVLTCLGCGHRPRRNKQPHQINGYYVDWCCREGRMFGMWALLARYDQVELEFQASSSNSDGPGLRRRLPRRGASDTQDSRGIGYADRGNYNPWANLFHGGPGGPPSALSRPIEFHGSDSKSDRFLTVTFHVVKELTPSTANKDLSPELRGMLQLSFLIDKLAELLRNDSLEDITSRAEVYTAAFQFVKKLGAHPELVSLVQTLRHHKRQTSGLESLTLRSTAHDHGGNRVLILGETIPSVAERLRKLARQSDIILGTRESEGLTSRAGKNMLDICEEITDVYAIIAPRRNQTVNDPQTVDKYAEYHQQYCLMRDESILDQGHKFNTLASRMMYSPQGRIKRLMVELANMATSLPVGIYVKASESRPDLMRCLIMGPPDSPYGYGLFDFDLLCKETYPKEPPIMACRTAQECRGQLNPNLHPDGKVCLSLLGTWREGDAAAQWQPGKSTILSVLISIQAMIFTEDPFRNEPANTNRVGRRADREAQMTIQKIQPLTIEYGMLAWLEKQQRLNGVWGNIVKAHFKLNKEKILTNINKWAQSNPAVGRGYEWYRSGVSPVERLRRQLDSLSGFS
uniref:UBE2O protein n=1 Tax=Coccidioides posadasii RMSCC 3488 TaxID=454284 RepID=A0A0J6FF83_COCPO|nr:UBE2O protein [Coccidioides posadasii RMSCC 3488]